VFGKWVCLGLGFDLYLAKVWGLGLRAMVAGNVWGGLLARAIKEVASNPKSIGNEWRGLRSYL
jgi:hypothetical protein